MCNVFAVCIVPLLQTNYIEASKLFCMSNQIVTGMLRFANVHLLTCYHSYLAWSKSHHHHYPKLVILSFDRGYYDFLPDDTESIHFGLEIILLQVYTQKQVDRKVVHSNRQ